MLADEKQRWISVVLLCLVNLVNYMDRYTVSGLLSDVQKAFEIDQSESGLLQTAFVICYFASAPLFGYLGDRYSRKWLMIVGIATWGSCSMAASFMPSYWPFLIARAAIGFGESGFTSIAPTVLGDLFSKDKRSLILALFYFAIPVGSGLGYMVGSGVGNLLGDWRWGLRVTPFLNLLLIILIIIFMVEPKRGNNEERSQKTAGEASLKAYLDDLAYLVRNRSFLLASLAFTCLSFCVGALSWFGPLFIEKALALRTEYGKDNSIEKDSVSFLFGMIVSLAGVAGLSLGTGLSVKLRNRFPRIDPIICGVGLVASTPFLFTGIGLAQNGVGLALALVFFGMMCLNMNWAVIVDISLYVVIPTRRASANAFQLMLSHALGEAGSPYLVGLLADSVKYGLEGLDSRNPLNTTIPMSTTETEYYSFQYALFATLVLEFVGGILFLWAAVYVIEDKRKATEYESELENSNDQPIGFENIGYKEEQLNHVRMS